MLNSFLQHPSKILKTFSKIYCNSKKLQYNTKSQLFITQCPDIAILGGDQMTITELAICFKKCIEVKGIQDNTIQRPQVAAFTTSVKV